MEFTSVTGVDHAILDISAPYIIRVEIPFSDEEKVIELTNKMLSIFYKKQGE
jgi:hypothetical protein